MEYHEAFWLATAAAGPVVALAHAVAIERSFDRLNGKINVPFQINLSRWVKDGTRRNLAKTRRAGERQTGPQKARGAVAALVVVLPFIAAFVGLSVCLFVTADSLQCLETEKDIYTRGSMEGAVSWSLLLLVVQLYLAFFLNKMLIVDDHADRP